MAEAMQIPYRFLRKIVRKLADENIVKSVRGKGGGISLIKQKDKLSLLTILDMFDPRSVNLNSCQLDKACCERIRKCNIHIKMAGVQKLMREKLEDITFDQLI
jgi:Rrf2 family protein